MACHAKLVASTEARCSFRDYAFNVMCKFTAFLAKQAVPVAAGCAPPQNTLPDSLTQQGAGS